MYDCLTLGYTNLCQHHGLERTNTSRQKHKVTALKVKPLAQHRKTTVVNMQVQTPQGTEVEKLALTNGRSGVDNSNPLMKKSQMTNSGESRKRSMAGRCQDIDVEFF